MIFHWSFELIQVFFVHNTACVWVDLEEAFSTPVGSPIVFSNQVRSTVFILIVANESDIQIDAPIVDAPVNDVITVGVVPEIIIGGVNCGGDGTDLKLLFDGINIRINLMNSRDWGQSILRIYLTRLLAIVRERVVVILVHFEILPIEILQGISSITAITTQILAINKLLRR